MDPNLHYDESDRQGGGGWPPDPEQPGGDASFAGPDGRVSFPRPFPAPAPAVSGYLPEGPPSVRPGQPSPPPADPPPPTPGAGNVADDPFDLGDPAGPRDAAAATAAADQATIMPISELLTLVSGFKVRVKPLRTRELLAIVNIGIGGIGPRMGDLTLDPDEPTEVFLAKFAGLMLSGLGAAGEEATAFLRMVCEPGDKVSTFNPDRAQKLRNKALDDALDRELHNPHPDDTLSILEVVVAMNGGDLQAWGKRLAGMVRLARRTGQIPASRTSPASNSSVG